MFTTFRQWVLLAAVVVTAGIMVNAVCASSVAAAEEVRNELRMPVDFTVLPLLQPEEMEPTEQAADPGQPEAPAVETAAQPEAAAQPEPQPEAQPAPAPSSPATAGPGRVTKVALAQTPSGYTVTVKTDRPVLDTSYMNLSNPRRLVLDLLGQWNYRGGNVIRSDGAVKHVVLGEHKDRLRLVVHYRTPPAGNVTPEFKADGNELLIMVPVQ